MADDFPFRYVPPVDPHIGRRVDQYFILRRLLGRGGMGAAYLAEHEASTHVKCVIKLVLAELAGHPMAISRYNTETEAVSRLGHDNIVKLQSFGVLQDGQLFSRFEYIDGKTLDRYVAEHGGRLDIRKATYIIFQLCDALQYAHDHGVVHRDLKPDNLMIEANPPGSHLTSSPAAAAAFAPSAAVAVPEPQTSTPSAPTAVPAGQRSRRPPAPVLAALPTGLVSQKYASQQPPVADLPFPARVPSLVAAAEIELAAGTRGPQPFAHADVPAVVVSTTQLSELMLPASAPGTVPPPRRPEPRPFVVLPGVSRKTRNRKLVVVGAVACAFAAMASVLIAGRLGSQPKPNDTGDAAPRRTDSGNVASEGSARNSGRALVVAAAATDAGEATPEPQLMAAVPTTPVAPQLDASIADHIATTAPADATINVQIPEAPRAPVPSTPPTIAVSPPSVRTPTKAAVPASKAPDVVAAKQAGRGRLTVHVDPFADVWIDGRFVKTTPIENLLLPVGTHRVRLVNEPGERDETTVVIIDAAKPVLIEKNW